MGVFDFLKTRNSSSKTEESRKPKDERKAECPNCSRALKKVPGAKTKCPHCEEYVFVRTKPDGVRLVVTKDEASAIDKQWAERNGEGDYNSTSWLHNHRNNVRGWINTGVVKTIKFFTAQDAGVCKKCAQLDGKVFDLANNNDARELMNADWVKECGHKQCRCYVRPEEISV